MAQKPEKAKGEVKKRRGRNEGTVYKRGSRWQAQMSVAGSKRRTFSGASKAEVQDAMARARTQHADGLLPEPSAVTVGMWLTHWLETVSSSGIAGSTRDYYAKQIDNLESLENFRLQKLRSSDIDAALNNLETVPARKKALGALRTALKAAVANGIISRNPCDQASRPRADKPEIHPLDVEGAKRFLKISRSSSFPELFTLAVWTGARQGELIASRFSDFDLKAKTWTIQRTISDSGGNVVIKTTKTKAGRRTISLDSHSVAAVLELRRLALRDGRAKDGYLFAGENGEPVDRFAVIRDFQRLRRQIGCETLRFHDLRHTSATLYLAANPGDVKTLSARLGHSSVVITLDLYCHVLGGQESAAVERMERLLG